METRFKRWFVAAAGAAAVWWGAAAVQAAEKPYVEDTPPRGFHLFLRPKMKSPEAQWDYVQGLAREGKEKKAARQAKALRLFWPRSEQAAEAQMFYARTMDGRGDLEEAFDAYQLMLDEYGAQCDFGAVLEDQLRLANGIMAKRHCAFFGLPGFETPAAAVPYYDRIAASAPEWEGTAEALFRTGQANEREERWEEAVEAYFKAMNRFPKSPFASDAAVAQARCHVAIAEETPNDERARDQAIAACDLVLTRWPNAPRAGDAERAKQRLLARRRKAAWELAEYYDRILKNAEAARIHYRQFAALYPDAPESARAAERLAALGGGPTAGEQEQR